MSMQRLRTDFRFAVVTLFGVIAVLGITPFAIYRFANGQALAGGVDLGIVLCLCAGTLHAWRGGDLDTTSLMVVTVLAVGCLAAVEVIGLPALLWMYPLLLGSFLVVDRGKALTITLAAVAVLALRGAGFADSLHAFSFVVTALVTSLFAYIFAERSERQRLQLEMLADHDALTGAFNRRTMSRELQVALEAASLNGTPVGLVLMDLDHFKRVNDINGHEDGDRVLVEFSGLVQAAIRAGDRFFRSGGEEFLLLAPHTDRHGLQALAENLRRAVEGRLRCGDDPVTVSVGLAMLRKGETATQWLGRADAAMYRAKNFGRNRVEVDEGRGGGEG